MMSTCYETLIALVNRDGFLTPQTVLDEAKAEDSPLHALFQWDDTIAANAYRLIQARKIIQRVRVTIDTPEQSTINVRAFINVIDDRPDDETPTKGMYVHYDEAVRTPAYRECMMRQALRELEAFRDKYRDLDALCGVFDAIEAIGISSEHEVLTE